MPIIPGRPPIGASGMVFQNGHGAAPMMHQPSMGAAGGGMMMLQSGAGF
jgi:hypothetical protein